MDFTFTAEQDDLRRAVRDLAGRRAGSAVVRAAMASDDGTDPDLWALVTSQLGLQAVHLDEGVGGFGGSWVDASVVLEEAGRALLPVPLLATVVAAGALQRAGADVALLAGLADGSRVGALGVTGNVTVDADRLYGETTHVLDGQVADVLVVVAREDGEDALYVLDVGRPGVRRDARMTLDQTRRQAAVRFDGAAATRVGGAQAAADAIDLLRVALAVESVGAARRCLELTVDHLQTRVQFGRPIGSFQALKHRVADLAVEVEAATSTAYYAAWAAADAPDELPVVAPLAKAVCTEAFFHVAAEAIQMHGGIGFTWEHDAHLYFKRATANRLLLGDARMQRRLVAQRTGLASLIGR